MDVGFWGGGGGGGTWGGFEGCLRVGSALGLQQWVFEASLAFADMLAERCNLLELALNPKLQTLNQPNL